MMRSVPKRPAASRRNLGRLAIVLAGATALAGCAATTGQGLGNVTSTAVAFTQDRAAADEAQLQAMLARMSLERKVAQLIQPDISSITPADVEQYRFGSILNGGNSGPGGNDLAPAPEWLALADAVWDASTKPLDNGEPVIPTLWATDAVHGHANIKGATIFPHNIALGATRDRDLIRRIGEATAVEIEVTGIDWTFAPTIAVARDDRWGRTYESYSEDPAIVSTMGAAMVEGLQGKLGSADFLGEGHVAATAKHFFGDGGTDRGVDQGDVNGPLDALEAIHVAPYPDTIAAGVAVVMASFNSINGRKMHGNRDLLTGVLRGELGFDGVVVGDWNGHGQIPGCTNSDCPQAILAGLDIYMVPEEWKALHANLVRQVQDGTIPIARLDEAVLRVLRLKQQLGMFGAAVRPSARTNAGQWDKLAAPRHRAIAREAVAKSLVLLKNDGVLPLKPGARILVTGEGADDIAQQAGGWTLTWQGGGDLTNADFPHATSIGAGMVEVGNALGAKVQVDPDADIAALRAAGAVPDVAIVVFGEKPYAEFAGDRKDLAYRDERHLAMLRAYRAAGIRTVAVFLSGRPLWVNRELNAADAFVAAWLPGSEGAGVADVLFGRSPATGSLSFSWPADCTGEPVNGPQGALFTVGYGRRLDDTTPLAALSEHCAALNAAAGAVWFASGRLGEGVSAAAGGIALPDLRGQANGIAARGIDRNAQEDAREIRFDPDSALTFKGPAAAGGFRITYLVNARPAAPVTVSGGGGAVDITQGLSVAEGKGWREMVLTPACLDSAGDELRFASQGRFTITIGAIAREEVAEGTDCSF